MAVAGDGHAPSLECLLHEPVERLFPFWGVVAVGGYVPDVRDFVLLQVGVHTLADVDEAIFVAAGEPEEFQLLGGSGVRQQFGGLLGVGRGGETADPRKLVHVTEPEVQGLAAAHRETGKGAMLAVRLRAVTGFNGGDDVIQQIALEHGKGRGGGEDVAFGTIVLLGAAVWHDDDHGCGLAVGDEVVQQHIRMGEAFPLGFIAADAVQEVEHGILLVLRVSGRCVDVQLALRAHGLGIVFDHLQLAVRDAVALFIEAFWRHGEGGFVILSENDLAAGDERFSGALLRASLGCIVLLRVDGQGSDGGGSGQNEWQRFHR